MLRFYWCASLDLFDGPFYPIYLNTISDDRNVNSTYSCRKWKSNLFDEIISSSTVYALFLYYLITNHIHVACLHENGYVHVLVNCKGDAACEVSARSRDIIICKQTCSPCNTCLNYPFKVLWIFQSLFYDIFLFVFRSAYQYSPSELVIVLSCVFFCFFYRIRR